jgi:AraC family transcriptional regulator of adaptative response/methylated-DNA-[protein]-cysteine methyltransferase
MLPPMRRRQRTRAEPVYRDGPLSVRRPEEIRYAQGRCPLGALLVASGESGIVSIIVREGGVKELRERLPKATLRQDADLKSVVDEVAAYIAAPFGRFALALDLRGTEFQVAVWREVQRIPFGKTSSYSRIAEAIGAPKAIRAVAGACSRCWWSFAVPCHRVLHKGGDARDANGRRRLRWIEYEASLAQD